MKRSACEIHTDEFDELKREFEELKREFEEVKQEGVTLDELIEFIDKAAKLQNKCAEYTIRMEWKAGQVLKELEQEQALKG